MSLKPAQVLIIEPAHELKFVGPFCAAVSAFMRLTNPTDHKVLFKIKTTAPKKYCVRPNCGVIDPKNTIEITIILQPFIFDATEKNKHKFMVQSMIMPENEEVSIAQLWQSVSADDLMDSKLRCVFELPMDTNQPQITANVASNTTSSQPTSVTPNKIESSAAAMMEPQNMGSVVSDDDKFADPSLVQEVKKLRDIECSLRQENLLLKERLLRMKMEMEGSVKEQLQQQQQSASPATSGFGGSSASDAASAAQYQNPYSPPQLAIQQQIPIVHVAVAIAMAIFGLILGKFVL